MPETVPTHIPPNFHVVSHNSGGGRRLVIEEFGQLVVDGIQNNVYKPQIEKLNAIPDNVEGLNLDAMYAFMERKGMRIAPHKVVDNDRIAEVKAINGSFEKAGINASYDSSLDIAIAPRNPELEQLNGPVYTEKLLVHELVHGSACGSRTEIKPLNGAEVIEPHLGRIGMLGLKAIEPGGKEQPAETESRGAFWEEGFAEYEAVQYVVEATGSPNGLLGGDSPIHFNGTIADGRKIEIDAKYFNKLPGDNVNYSANPSFPAMALDLLIQRRPELEQLMIDQRKGDTFAHRAVIQTINNISPGLYEATRKLQYTTEDFASGLAEVQSRLAAQVGQV